jgi:hypothetical protein
MKLTSFLRVRNEELLIEDTLNHLSIFSDEILVLDDASTDKTLSVCQAHPKVTMILQNKVWAGVPTAPQAPQLQMLLWYAQVFGNNEWCLNLDADERIDEPETFLTRLAPALTIPHRTGIAFPLYDSYMTVDLKEPYQGGRLLDLERLWGPEYRWITLVFKKDAAFFPLSSPDSELGQRSPDGLKCAHVGAIQLRHYGKGLSVEQWERKVTAYSETCSDERLTKKWLARRGKCIRRAASDYGRTLWTWPELMKRSIIELPPVYPKLRVWDYDNKEGIDREEWEAGEGRL